MKIFCSLLVVLTVASCAPAEKTWTEDQVLDQAKGAAQLAFKELSSELAKAMAKGGPPEAIPVCSDKAGSITNEVADLRGVKMVRLSHRPRNPAQRAEGEDLQALEALRNDPKPRITWQDDGGAVVHLPIVLNNPLCLQCHGGKDDIAPATREILGQLYPEDEATGFSLNDLRGVWRITVPPREEN